MERIMGNMVSRAATLAFLGLLLSFPIGCSRGFHGEGGPGSWRGHHPASFGKDFSERILKHVDKQVEALNLTPVQKEKYILIREQVKSDLAGMREMRTQFRSEARQEIMKENPDIHVLAGMLSQHGDKLHAFMEQSSKRFVEFYDILDESQKAKVMDHLRRHLSKMHANSDIGGPFIGALRLPEGAGKASQGEGAPDQAGSKIGELL